MKYSRVLSHICNKLWIETGVIFFFPNQGVCLDFVTFVACKKNPFQNKIFKYYFLIQLPFLPQLPPSNLRQLPALPSPKAKMLKVCRVPLPLRLFLVDANDLQCLPPPLLLPHRSLARVPQFLPCYLL